MAPLPGENNHAPARHLVPEGAKCLCEQTSTTPGDAERGIASEHHTTCVGPTSSAWVRVIPGGAVQDAYSRSSVEEPQDLMGPSLNTLEKVCNQYVQSPRQFRQRSERWLSLPSLNSPDVGPV